MGDAAQLDVNSSFYGGITQLGVIIAFLCGILILAIFDHFAVPRAHSYDEELASAMRPEVPQEARDQVTTTTSSTSASAAVSASSSSSSSGRMQGGPSVKAQLGMDKNSAWRGTRILYFLIPAGIAVVMGIHGLGEGWGFASVAAAAQTNSIATAFGGVLAIVSYPLHKFLEAGIIACVYTIFVGRNGLARRERWHVPLLGLFFGLGSVVGAAVGYFASIDTTYFYAFGVTSAIYAMIRLVEGMFAAPPSSSSASTSVSATSPKLTSTTNPWTIIPAYLGGRVFLALVIGFFLLYTAALFH